MSYYGDIRLGETLDVKFTTRRFTTGAPHTLAGSPVISAYVGNGTTEITAGITLTVDFDGRTGLNNVRVVASGGNGFATATNVQLVITTGTVDSVSVVGEVIGTFSIENRSAVMPATAGRTLLVESDGMVQADVREWLGVATAADVTGIPNVNVEYWLGTAPATPTTAGVPEVDLTHWLGVAPLALSSQRVQSLPHGGIVIPAGHIGDTDLDSPIYFDFTTTDGAGTPTTLIGSPTIAAWKDADTTQSVAGMTLSVNHDGLTGTHRVTISSNAFFTDNSTYTIRLTAGTVNGVTVTGHYLASFTLKLATIWNVFNVQDKTGYSLTQSFPSNFAALGINASGHVSRVTVTDAVTGAVGSVTGNVGGNVVGSVASVTGNVGGNVVGSVASVTGNVGGNVTGNLGGTLTTTERNAIADALLDRANAIETGVTLRQSQQRIGAVVAGRCSGAGTATEVFVGLDEATTRVTMTVDASGNRSDVTYA